MNYCAQVLSLRLVIGALISVLLVAVALLTFFLVYDVSLKSLRDLGQRHASMAARRSGSIIEGTITEATNLLQQLQRTVHDSNFPGMRFAYSNDYPPLGDAKDLGVAAINDTSLAALAQQLNGTTAGDVDLALLGEYLNARQAHNWELPWLAACQGLRSAVTEGQFYYVRLLDWTYMTVAADAHGTSLISIGKGYAASAADPEVTLYQRSIFTYANGSDASDAGLGGVSIPEQTRPDNTLTFQYLGAVAAQLMAAGGFSNPDKKAAPRGFFLETIFKDFQYMDGTRVPSGGLPAGVPLINASGVFIGAAGLSMNSKLSVSNALASGRPTPSSEMFAVDGFGFVAGATIGEIWRVATYTGGAVSTGCSVDTEVNKIGCRYTPTAFPFYAPLNAVPRAAYSSSENTTVGRFTSNGDAYVYGTSLLHNDLSNFVMRVVAVMPEADIIGEVQKQRDINIGIVAGCFVAAAIVGFALVYRVLLPLETIARRMRLAADFIDEDTDDEAVKRSSLLEVADLQDAFMEMHDELQRLKSFVPQAVLLQRRNRAISDDYASFADNEPSIRALTESHHSAAVTVTATGRDEIATMTATVTPGVMLPVSLVTRNVTVMSANFTALHAALQGRSAEQTRRVIELLTLSVLSEARQERGVMDAFHGDHFTVTFNCVAPCAMHASRAVGAAIAIGRRVRAAGTHGGETAMTPLAASGQIVSARRGSGSPPPLATSGAFDAAPLQLSAGIASGPARLGDFGCADAKRFMTVGPVVPAAVALERLGRRHPREAQWTPTPDNAYRIVVPAGLLEDLRTGYVCECVDVAALPLVPPSIEAVARQHVRDVPHAVAQVVREAHGGKMAAHDEWMYVVGDNADVAAPAGIAGTQQRVQVGATLMALAEAARRARFPSARDSETSNDAIAALSAAVAAISDPSARAMAEAMAAHWGVSVTA